MALSFMLERAAGTGKREVENERPSGLMILIDAPNPTTVVPTMRLLDF